jgi:hypothetical protein
MDNYESYLFWSVCTRNLVSLSFAFEVTDAVLESLVREDIISSVERYEVFSYPLPTVFNNPLRIGRLFEILRNSKRWIPFLQFLKSQSISFYPLCEFLIRIKVHLYEGSKLNRFGCMF